MNRAGILIVGAMALIAVGFLSAATCGSSAEERGEPGDMTLGEALEAVPGAKYRLYWLGENVAVDEFELGGPLVCAAGCELTEEVMEGHYVVVPGGADLRWAIATQEEWSRARGEIESPRIGTVEASEIEVAGREAKLLRYLSDEGALRFLRVVIFADETTVVVATLSSGAPVEEDVFLEMLEGFRPYPS